MITLECRPCRVNDEGRQTNEHKQRADPPGVTSCGLAEPPLSQRNRSGRHRQNRLLSYHTNLSPRPSGKVEIYEAAALVGPRDCDVAGDRPASFNIWWPQRRGDWAGGKGPAER